MSGASAEVSRNRNAAWPFGVATLGMLVPGIDGNNQEVELFPVDQTCSQRFLDLAHVHGRHKHIVADHRQDAVRGVEQHRLRAPFIGQQHVGDGFEQLLRLDHANDGEEHHQEGGKRQRLLECLAKLVFLDHTIERSGQDDDAEPDDAGRREMGAERDHQQQGYDRLHDQFGHITLGTLLGFLAIEVFQHFPHALRQLRAVAEPLQLLEQRAGDQPDHQHRHRHRRDAQEELDELPACLLREQQVLRLTHEGGHATQCGAHRTVHHEAAQEAAKLLEVCPTLLSDAAIVIAVIHVIVPAAADAPVVDAEEPYRHGNDHGGHGQRIQKRTEECGGKAEQQ